MILKLYLSKESVFSLNIDLYETIHVLLIKIDPLVDSYCLVIGITGIIHLA